MLVIQDYMSAIRTFVSAFQSKTLVLQARINARFHTHHAPKKKNRQLTTRGYAAHHITFGNCALIAANDVMLCEFIASQFFKPSAKVMHFLDKRNDF